MKEEVYEEQYAHFLKKSSISLFPKQNQPTKKKKKLKKMNKLCPEERALWRRINCLIMFASTSKYNPTVWSSIKTAITLDEIVVKMLQVPSRIMARFKV